MYQVPFLKFWYDPTGDRTQISQTIGEHSTHLANEPVVVVTYMVSSMDRVTKTKEARLLSN